MDQASSAPSSNGFAITPHATNRLPATVRRIYVGSAGNLVVKLKDANADVTFTGVPAGTVLEIVVTHVRATSTAGSLVGLI